MIYCKKLIEVALPLEVINQGSKSETENPFLKGHPRAIHNWWARTPLSIAFKKKIVRNTRLKQPALIRPAGCRAPEFLLAYWQT